MQPVAAALRALADGDLTARLDVPDLARDFEAAAALYGKTVFALASSATAIRARVRDIAAQAEALAAREADAFAPARAALDEAMQAAEARRREAQALRAALTQEREAGAQTRAALAAAAGALERVGAERGRLGEIAERIASFAFQTHLIAINAGVEAARAGEAGRGIAIVAQELRALSQRSAEATDELSSSLAALAGDAGRQAAALRAGVGDAVAPTPPEQTLRVSLGPVSAALDAAARLAARDVEIAATVGEASHSLEVLVTKLSALAGHFRYPGAEDAAPAPTRPATLARLEPPWRLKAG
jgi:methyl-accepting chemotaxis protein